MAGCGKLLAEFDLLEVCGEADVLCRKCCAKLLAEMAERERVRDSGEAGLEDQLDSLRAELEAAQRRLTDAYGQLDTIHMETHCADPSLETIQEQSAPDGECWDCGHPEGLSDATREEE